MNLRQLTIAALLAITSAYANLALSENREENDFAVPAFSDLPLLGEQATTSTPDLDPKLSQTNLNLVPLVSRLKWFDLNRDLQLNEFDVKQFEAVIESLNGSKLTGLQISTRFREKQKNQKEFFLLAYDLDRDSMFTLYDVDYLTRVLDALDEGRTLGDVLVQKFSEQIFPSHSASGGKNRGEE